MRHRTPHMNMIQPFALRGVLTTVGNDADGAPRAVVHCARDAIASQPSLPMYQPVVIVEAKWLDVEAPLNGAGALANAAKVIEAGEKDPRELIERLAVYQAQAKNDAERIRDMLDLLRRADHALEGFGLGRAAPIRANIRSALQ